MVDLNEPAMADNLHVLAIEDRSPRDTVQVEIRTLGRQRGHLSPS
jgi:hypothetical protein